LLATIGAFCHDSDRLLRVAVPSGRSLVFERGAISVGPVFKTHNPLE
jgi:hypothetical protein